MTSQMRFLASASLLAVAALGATPALAAGTASGTDITNTVTLSYQVGSVTQTPVQATNVFKVDRKVNLTVAELGSTTTSVTPGQAVAVTTFTVTNNSNATLDFALAVAQQAGGTGPHGGTDSFDVSTPTLYIDSNTNNVYDSGTDVAASYVDEVLADTSRTVFVVAAIPLGETTNEVASVTLTATAHNAGVVGTQGSIVTQDAATANTAAGVETVFADVVGATDALKDGKHSARDDYTVQAAALTVTKTSYVISDPFSSSNPKMIPGAVVEYCITVSNATGSANAANVSLNDPIPTGTAYVTNSIMLGATPGAPCTGGTAGGSIVSGAVVAPIGAVNAGTSTAVRFQVTVQ